MNQSAAQEFPADIKILIKCSRHYHFSATSASRLHRKIKHFNHINSNNISVDFFTRQNNGSANWKYKILLLYDYNCLITKLKQQRSKSKFFSEIRQKNNFRYLMMYG